MHGYLLVASNVNIKNMEDKPSETNIAHRFYAQPLLVFSHHYEAGHFVVVVAISDKHEQPALSQLPIYKLASDRSKNYKICEVNDPVLQEKMPLSFVGLNYHHW